MLTSQSADHDIRTIATTVHGRYLLRPGPPERLLVGFHGYAESAAVSLREMLSIPGIGAWSVAAVQALHRFYTRDQNVVANWMTREDRELAIADNTEYVRRVVAELPPAKTLVFLGFSQGTAMAYRAAAAIPCQGVIALGGDVPPDVPASSLPRVLIGRGTRDEWYSAEKLQKDVRYLEDVTTCVFDGGHEWSDEFRRAAGEFLMRE